jgi:hypothetical protein
LIAVPATPGLWIDLSQKPSTSQAHAIIAALDPVGVIRTLPLPNNNPAQDLDSVELAMWCSLGRQVMAYQHVRASRPGMPPGWDPRNFSGEDDGAFAAEHAVRCGMPAGVTIWVDWEDIVLGLPPSYGTIYLEAWAGRALASSLRAGEYCGFDDPMSAQERYDLRGITSYWSDGGHRAVAIRGCSIIQGSAITVAGIQIDRDHLELDHLNEVPWACASDLSEVA